MNNPNIERVWKDRKELEDFRNVDRLAAYQIAMHNGAVMTVLFQARK